MKLAMTVTATILQHTIIGGGRGGDGEETNTITNTIKIKQQRQR